MDHTPATPAQDDRPLKLLERTPVSDDHKERLFALVHKAQALATDADDELQSEFGKEHVALITGCNQFARLFRGGDGAGRVELLLPDAAKQALTDAGFTLAEPEGAIFRMFGWVRIDPMEGDLDQAEAAVEAAYQKARSG